MSTRSNRRRARWRSRVDKLEAARQTDRQTEAAVAAARAELQQLEQRLGAIEAQSASRAASETAELQKIQQELSRLGQGRRRSRAPSGRRWSARCSRKASASCGPTRMLALLLVQMREAVEQARPFPAEYNAFVSARRRSRPRRCRPAARRSRAQRGGEPRRSEQAFGRTGRAGRDGDRTRRRRRRLGRAGPRPAARAGDDPPHRRRIANRAGSGGRAPPKPRSPAAIWRAPSRRSSRSTGANAEAARPWLRMARERLAVETALDHLQELLTARLGSSPAAPGAAPAKVPDEPERRERHRDPRPSRPSRLCAGWSPRRFFSPIIPGRSRLCGRAGRSRPRSACWPPPRCWRAWRLRCCFWLVSLILGSPRAFLRRRRERRRRAGYRALTQGMVAVAAGDPQEAQRYAPHGPMRCSPTRL